MRYSVTLLIMLTACISAAEYPIEFHQAEYPIEFHYQTPEMRADYPDCDKSITTYQHGCCKSGDVVMCIGEKPLVKMELPQIWESEPLKIVCTLSSPNEPIRCVMKEVK